jgi:SlyX protein
MGSSNAEAAGIPMTDANASETERLRGRIDALETRLTYLDETIETLNTTITAQWKTIDGLTRRLALLGERLQEAENRAPGATNEPPPHY